MSLDKEIILTTEQMSMYYMGYADGIKWIIKFMNRDNRCERSIIDEEREQFFESIKKRMKRQEAAEECL